MRITRKDLYDLIWTKPLKEVSPSLGLSDVGLAKLCQRHNVPRPNRGHWTRVAQGEPPERAPLEGDDSAVVEITPQHPYYATQRAERRKRKEAESLALQEIGLIVVPDHIDDPHPLTVKTEKHFRDIQAKIERAGQLRSRKASGPDLDALGVSRFEHRGRYFCYPCLGGYNLTVSLSQLDRALRLLDTLVRALGNQDFRVAITKSRNDDGTTLEATKLGEGIGFDLVERYNQKRLSDDEAKALQQNRFSVPKLKFLPNGRFMLKIWGRVPGTEMEWTDGSGPIEEKLHAVVAGFIDLVGRQKEVRVTREREAQERQKRELERERERIAQQARLEEFRRVLNEAEQVHRLNMLESYLQTLEKYHRTEFGDMSEQVLAWFQSMREMAVAQDPMQRRLRQLTAYAVEGAPRT